MILVILIICVFGLRKVGGNIPIVTEDGICMQNCSWISENPEGEEKVYLCEINITKDNVMDYNGCPNPVHTEEGKPDIFPDVAENLNASFYSIPHGTDGLTETCVNITFTFRDASAEKLRGVQILLFGTSYLSQGDNYCQNFIFTSTMTGCAVLDDMCDLDSKRVFYYDCFCNIKAGGEYTLSLLTLPAHKDDDESLSRSSIGITASACYEFSTDWICTQNYPKQFWWSPTILEANLGCDLQTVDVTFSLAPLDYDIKNYMVFLINKDTQAAKTTTVMASESAVQEVNSSSMLLNITTVTFNVNNDEGIFYPAVEIIDDPLTDYYYYIKFNKSSEVKVEVPCKSLPCGEYANCSYTECTNYICECHEDYTKINGFCGDGLAINNIHAEQKAPPYEIYVSFDILEPALNVISYTVGIFHVHNHAVPLVEEIKQIGNPSPQRSVSFIIENTTTLVSTEVYTAKVKISNEECPGCNYVGSQSDFTYYVNACISNPCGRYQCTVLTKDEYQCKPCMPWEMPIGENCRDFVFIITAIVLPIVIFTVLVTTLVLNIHYFKNRGRDLFQRIFNSSGKNKDTEHSPEMIFSPDRISVCVIFNSEKSFFQRLATELCSQLHKIPWITAYSMRCDKINEHVASGSGQAIDYIRERLSKEEKVILLADNCVHEEGKVIQIAIEATEKLNDNVTATNVSVVYLQLLGEPKIPACSFRLMNLSRDFDLLIEFLLQGDANNTKEDHGLQLEEASEVYQLKHFCEVINSLEDEIRNMNRWDEIKDSDGSSLLSVPTCNSVSTMVSVPSRFIKLGEVPVAETVEEFILNDTVSFASLAV